MPFNHNHHYHPLLLRQVPEGARRALDVGCGLGMFARRLAAKRLEVDADGDAIAAARVLAVLGLANPRSAADLGKWLVLGPPLNLAARAVVAAGERLNGGRDATISPRVRPETMTMTEIRRESARLLRTGHDGRIRGDLYRRGRAGRGQGPHRRRGPADP